MSLNGSRMKSLVCWSCISAKVMHDLKSRNKLSFSALVCGSICFTSFAGGNKTGGDTEEQ